MKTTALLGAIALLATQAVAAPAPVAEPKYIGPQGSTFTFIGAPATANFTQYLACDGTLQPIRKILFRHPGALQSRIRKPFHVFFANRRV